MKLARALVAVLEAEGIDLAAGHPGVGTADLIGELRTSGGIRSLLVRHERVAVDMADGHARASGRIAVSFASAGPGAAQAVTGLAQSAADCVPLLHLQGQVSGGTSGPRVTQRVDTAALFKTVVREVVPLHDPSLFHEAMQRCFHLLRTPPGGPVVLEVPDDIWRAAVPAGSAKSWQPVSHPRIAADSGAVEQAARLLCQAKRPMILAGAGAAWAGARTNVISLAEHLGAPVATTLNAKGLFPEDHQLSLGLGGFPSALYATPQARWFARGADLVLAVGNSFKEFATGMRPWPRGTTLIHITADSNQLDRVYQSTVPLLGDAALTLQQLIDQIGEVPQAGQRRQKVARGIAGLKRKWLTRWEPHLSSTARPISPYRVLGELMRATEDRETLLLHDAGSARGYAGHLYQTSDQHRFVGMGGQSTMGWSLGAAMGAALACPHRAVIHLIGDGALGMVGMDLETAAREKIPILTVVLNNGVLGVTRAAQRKGEEHLVAMGGDYRGVATALGVEAERVEDADTLGQAINQGLKTMATGRPYLIEVLVGEEDVPAGGRSSLVARLLRRAGMNRTG